MPFIKSKSGISGESGLHGKSGLHGFTGLFTLFDPIELNPYLLFDTRTSMLGELESPTLDLNPAVPSSLDVITATRSGVATYIDADGLIQTADPNTVRVDYVQGEELTPTVYQNIGYTDFSSGWSTYLGSTALGDGYDGQASLVCSFSGNGQSYYTFTSVGGAIYTGSFWARAVSASGPYRLWHGNSASGSSTYINLTSEWQFFSLQFLGRSGGGNMYFGIGAATGDVVEIAMPQVEEGTTATDFVPNTTGSPKFIASATYGPRVPMMLIEPSATNLLPYSEDFSVWTELNTTITVNDSLAPDGNQTAAKVTADSGSAVKRISSYAATDSVTDYTVSFYAKAGSHQFVQTTVSNSGALYANFDLISGQSQAFGGATSKMTLAANGFYRCEFTFTGAASLGAGYLSFADSLTHARGDSSSSTGDFYIWGTQVEQVSVATSYIPTNGSAVTRNADQLSITGSNFTNFFNSGGDGTFYAEFIPRDVLGEQWYLLAAQDYDRRFMYTNVGDAGLNAYDGTTQHSYGQDMVANQLNRAAITYTSTTQEASLDGSTTAPATHNGNYLTASRLYLSSPVNDSQMNGHLKRLIYWPTHSDSL